ncbi:MAG: phosphate ABC transporter substrate-binding protein PstS [Acidobacteria bacterium]|nr:phosphate ABC transporter substrate-binding protein PstS [Acidobacteriota bacterium]MCA1651393.1 phosphate ABC transporter substrate-binding protein PstS [Acidobacteriota bacterium]
MRQLGLGVALLAAVTAAACSGSSQPPASQSSGAAGSARGAAQITGAGATFPNPLYSKWFSDYNKLHPNVEINYQSQGSGAGIRQLISRTVFFGATDGPMTDEQLKAASDRILHFPTVLGAVVPVYNLPNFSGEMKVSGPVLAEIILGNIKKWNDPALAKLNPGVTLPATDITVVHRSDGSGTTFIWVDYLSKVSPAFKSKVGVDTSVSWPVGVGGKGNEGVAGLVRQTPGALGYVESIYAQQNKIAYAAVENSAGAFVKASVDSVTAAAAGAAAQLPDDFRVSITNAPGADAYPIASFTWILLYENPENKAHATVMVDFLKWALTDGQASARELGYAALPRAVVDKEMIALQKIRLQ